MKKNPDEEKSLSLPTYTMHQTKTLRKKYSHRLPTRLKMTKDIKNTFVSLRPGQ